MLTIETSALEILHVNSSKSNPNSFFLSYYLIVVRVILITINDKLLLEMDANPYELVIYVGANLLFYT